MRPPSTHPATTPAVRESSELGFAFGALDMVVYSAKSWCCVRILGESIYIKMSTNSQHAAAI